MKKKTKKSAIKEIMETKYCGNDYCDAEASFITSNGMPLCDSCAEMYRLGQDNPEPLEDI